MTLDVSEEARAAQQAQRALVALETSVVAHGLPAPQNLQSWEGCDAAVRKAGAVPACIGVLAGKIRVGLSRPEVERLANGAAKIGSGELAWAVARGLDGGTTVSATCEIAHQAGIRVVATGGIGGVHRGEALDVSQDLWVLARTPVAVVCSGAKLILDLERTLEALEALAVPVLGIRTDTFPAFTCASSGLPLSMRVDTAAEAAAVAREHLARGKGAILCALPPPPRVALDLSLVERHVATALAEAESKGVKGKAVTPFLLQALALRTDGRTLEANLKLLENNAAFAGALAMSL